MRVAGCFIGGKMRTAAQETASQIALKLLQCSWGDGQYTCDFGEGGVHAIKHMFLRSISLAASGGSCSMLDLCCTFCCCA